MLTPEAAHAHAVTNIRELVCEDVRKRKLSPSRRIDVTSEARESVTSVRFAEEVSRGGIEEARHLLEWKISLTGCTGSGVILMRDTLRP